MNVFQKVPENVRKAIYIGMAVVLAALVGAGIVTTDQISSITDQIVKILAVLATLMAASNVNSGQ